MSNKYLFLSLPSLWDSVNTAQAEEYVSQHQDLYLNDAVFSVMKKFTKKQQLLVFS